MYSAKSIAQWFVAQTAADSGEYITNLKLQKLLYYAQAWHLVLYEKPLFDEKIEAWAHGPVVPAVYKTYKDYGWQPIPPVPFKGLLSTEAEHVLKEVLRVYGIYSARFLEQLTHQELPWMEARKGLTPEEAGTTPISHDSMKRFYGEKLKQKP